MPSASAAQAIHSAVSPENLALYEMHTFGCVISEAVTCKQYSQYLGLIDALGFLNSLNNLPEHRPLADHSTNSLIPLGLQVSSSLANASV